MRSHLWLAIRALNACGDVEQAEAETIDVTCAKAFGRAGRIKDIRTLRLEVIYPDHSPAPVSEDILLSGGEG